MSVSSFVYVKVLIENCVFSGNKMLPAQIRGPCLTSNSGFNRPFRWFQPAVSLASTDSNNMRKAHTAAVRVWDRYMLYCMFLSQDIFKK